VTVALASSSAGVTVPADVTVAAGQSSATCTATGKSTGSATLSAKRSGSSTEKAHRGLKGGDADSGHHQVKSMVVAPASLQPGESSTGTVTLEAPASVGDVSVDLASSKQADVPVASFVIVRAGQTTATFDRHDRR
jgi:hypothetical protein